MSLPPYTARHCHGEKIAVFEFFGDDQSRVLFALARWALLNNRQVESIQLGFHEEQGHYAVAYVDSWGVTQEGSAGED